MLADVYVLASARSTSLIEQFLDRFLPFRAVAAVEYEVPQYAAQPEVVLENAADLIRLCEQRPELQHAIYWHQLEPGGDPHSAHVFFLPDGGLVLGLSTGQWEVGGDRLLSAMMEFADSRVGYITFEQPPAATSDEFRSAAAAVTG